jgi:hypothetical protein
MIARLRGEPARGPSLFSQTLVDENDVVTFERATPEQEAFVRTMLEGVDPDIFKAETGLEKGEALPAYDPPRITSITHESGILETMLGLAAEKNRLQHEAREGFAVELAERIQADLAAMLVNTDDSYEGRWGQVIVDLAAEAHKANIEMLRQPSADAYEVPPAMAQLWDDEAAERDRFARVVFAAEDTEPDK